MKKSVAVDEVKINGFKIYHAPKDGLLVFEVETRDMPVHLSMGGRGCARCRQEGYRDGG